jgi:hypothetical protein
MVTPPKGRSFSILSIKPFLKNGLSSDSTITPKKCATKKPSRGCKEPPKGPSPSKSLVPHICCSTSPIPPSSPSISTPPPSPIPSSQRITWSLQNKEAHKYLDIKNIYGSRHRLQKDFKEWLPTFSWEHLIETVDHVYIFLCSVESYD